jgi:hypothetical protein
MNLKLIVRLIIKSAKIYFTSKKVHSIELSKIGNAYFLYALDKKKNIVIVCKFLN